MDWINSIISHYNEITKTNPLIATLVIPIVAGLMIYLKNVPRFIWNWIVRNTTVTMNLNNAGWDGNVDAYNTFDMWFMMSGYKRFSRNFFMFRQYRDEMFAGESWKPYRMGIGNGTHIFFYEGRFFWFHKGKLESSGSEKQKEEITIRTFGWNHKVFEDLVDLFNKKKTGDEAVSVHSFKGENWTEVGTIPHRDISTFCMNQQTKNEIIGKLQTFFDSREWYRSKGLTYKISFLFLGPPGTGKTTLAKLLGVHFKRDLYILDLSRQSNASLIDALSKIKPGSILLLEDVDQAGNAVRKRKNKEEGSLIDAFAEMGQLTMSGMLNAFDGVVALDNIVVMMTSNHPEDLDDAIRRKSRIDHEYLIDELTTTEIWKYCQQMYDLEGVYIHPDPMMLSFLNSKAKLPGCEVEYAFKENPDDPVAFMNAIAKRCDERPRKVA